MNTTASDITFQDLRTYLKSFDDISEAAKQVYNQLSNEGKVAADRWSKETLYNYLNQFFNLDSQSAIAKQMRSIVTNGSTNVADLVKYVGKIP
jgi:DNA mismatch repair ATPase MutS